MMAWGEEKRMASTQAEVTISLVGYIDNIVFIVLLLALPGPLTLPGGVQGGEGVGDADEPAVRLVAFLQKKTFELFFTCQY